MAPASLGVFALAALGDLASQNDGPIAAPAPRVSVILPVRDGGAYLADAVASILGQSFANLELLLIDDGSRDGAVAALAPLAARDPRLRLLENPGAGLVAALNYGLGQACAALVARMDADDVALPDRLARQVAFLDASPKVALVGAQVAFIDAAGAPTGERSHFPTAPEAVAAALATRGCVIRRPTIVARKAALVAAGGYRLACERAEDYDLWLRLSERTRLANLPDALRAYRVHGGQTSAGINLGQRFARDLALVAVRGRRSERADPLDGAGEALRFDWPFPADWPTPPSVAALVSAYDALAYFEGRAAPPPDAPRWRASSPARAPSCSATGVDTAPSRSAVARGSPPAAATGASPPRRVRWRCGLRRGERQGGWRREACEGKTSAGATLGSQRAISGCQAPICVPRRSARRPVA
jgi:glycosyltransferase involved in cell wall biosynthesis